MTLLRRIEQHMRRTGITATRLGRGAINDPRLVRDLRDGRVLRARTAARVLAYLDGREGERG